MFDRASVPKHRRTRSQKLEADTSAADLKFLHRLPQARSGTSNRKAALAPYTSECPFASEAGVRACCHVSRTSEAGTRRSFSTNPTTIWLEPFLTLDTERCRLGCRRP